MTSIARVECRLSCEREERGPGREEKEWTKATAYSLNGAVSKHPICLPVFFSACCLSPFSRAPCGPNSGSFLQVRPLCGVPWSAGRTTVTRWSCGAPGGLRKGCSSRHKPFHYFQSLFRYSAVG